MTRTHPDHLAPKGKVVQSRFILLNEPSAHSLVAQINWDEVIPFESNGAFYNSLNTQMGFFRDIYSRFAQIRTMTTIFRISNATYYQVQTCCLTESTVTG
jgi:hypothetical protein